MEDVNISKFRAQVVRAGSTPASPGFVVSEGQNPVDPSGSGQNHLPVTIATASTGLSITESQVLGGAGTVGQYIRGDGSLADFPATTGGGSSVSYYLNGSVSQGTIGGVAYKELNKTPVFGAGTDITINADGYIASFITDAGDPNKLLIPAGNWNLETFFSASSSGGTPSFYVELYKYNGTTFTLIASSSSAPELIAFGTNLNPYFSTLAVPETVLALTDRLALRYYVTHSGRTITLHTENNHLCQVITTFTSGLTALNGLTSQVQYLTVGTSGTDFAISSATDTHTFNLPTASATNRGALSSADWTTFNNKTSNLGTVTSVGLSSATSGVTIGSTPVTTSGTITLAIATASGSQNGLLSSTDWTTFNGKQNALTNPVTGTGTTNYLPKFTGASTIGNSVIQDSGTTVTISSNLVAINGNGITEFKINNNTSEWEFYMPAGSTDLRLYRGTDKVTFFANGNVLVGTGSDAGFKLDVNGTGRFSGLVTISGVANNYFQSNRSGTSAHFQTWYESNGTTRRGYFGYGEGGTSNFSLMNEQSGSFVIGTNSINAITIASTGAATFLTSVSVAGLQLGSTYASKLGVYNSSSAANMELGTATNTNGTIVSRATFYNVNNGNTGNESSANFIGIASIETQLVTANSNASGTSGGTIIFKTKRDGGTLDNTLILASTGAATFSSSVTADGLFRSNQGVLQIFAAGGFRGGVYNYASWLGSGTDYSPTLASETNIYFATAGSITRQMTITSGGNLLIGTTTDGGDKLQVNGAIKTSAPSGGTAGSWKFGTATSGIFTIGGKIRIEINGVAYDILTT